MSDFHAGATELFRAKIASRLSSQVVTLLATTLFFSFAMHHIIYLSWATVPFSDEQLHALLQKARSHNEALGITGLLLHGNGCFLQVLEGEEATVRDLYEQIKRDTRHRDVTAYADKAIAQRAFTGWAMAFQATTPEQFEELAGYLEPADVTLDASRLSLVDMHLLDLLRSFTQA
jgi:hypothetical protein